MFLGYRENWEVWIGVSIVDVFKDSISSVFFPPRRIPKLRKAQSGRQLGFAVFHHGRRFRLIAHTR